MKFIKFILIIILFIKQFLYDIFNSDDSSSVKERKFRISDFYIEANKISKELNDMEKVTISIKEKDANIKKLYKKYENIEKNINDIETKNIFKKETIEMIKKVNKNNLELLDYYKERYKPAKKALVKSKDNIKEIKDYDILNLSTFKESDKTRDIYALYVLEANKVLKDSKDIINEVLDDIKNTNKSFNNEYKIEELKKQIKKIKDSYYDFKHNRYIYELENDFNLNEIDKYGILKNSNALDECLKKCELILKKIDDAKRNEDKKEEIVKKQEEKELRKQEEKEAKKPKILLEINDACTSIEKDVMKKENRLARFEKSLTLSKTYERKIKKMNYFDNVLTHTIRMSLVIPYKVYKTRGLNRLVSICFMNNNIRYLRKILTNNLDSNYLLLSRYIKGEEDILKSYERVLNDSLYQISTLKEEYIKYYGYMANNEIKKTYLKLQTLEDTLNKDLDKLEIREVNLKEKVKTLRRH